MSGYKLFMTNLGTAFSIGSFAEAATGSPIAGVSAASATVFGLLYLFELSKSITETREAGPAKPEAFRQTIPPALPGQS